MIRVGVIGAGVAGLSSALNVLASIPNASVTIIADQIGPETTSYGAGGLYRPDLDKLVTADNRPIIERCLRDSWHHFAGLAKSDQCKESGNMFVSGMMVHRKATDSGYELMKELTLNFHKLTEREVKRMEYPEEFKHVYTCTTVISQANIYMDWLYKQFKSKGGTIQRRTLKSLEELYGDYQVVINCCGLRAFSFLDDQSCFPQRGQLALMNAPWMKQFHYLDNDIYIIPHMDKVVVGGIRIDGDWNTTVEPKVTEDILRKAEAIFPQLKGAELIQSWAGLRPARTVLRLEKETIKFGDNRTMQVVHNYGHAGNGITLSWGTGVYAAKLARDILLSSAGKSKL